MKFCRRPQCGWRGIVLSPMTSCSGNREAWLHAPRASGNRVGMKQVRKLVQAAPESVRAIMGIQGAGERLPNTMELVESFPSAYGCPCGGNRCSGSGAGTSWA